MHGCYPEQAFPELTAMTRSENLLPSFHLQQRAPVLILPVPGKRSLALTECMTSAPRLDAGKIVSTGIS